jgi:hypothetical protein
MQRGPWFRPGRPREEQDVSADFTHLQEHLDGAPGDAEARLILADLFEDQGDLAAARCQRWLAEHKKWPDADLDAFLLKGWHWWAAPDLRNRSREHAVLPEEVQAHMPGERWLYRTRSEAEAVLAAALSRLEAAASL